MSPPPPSFLAGAAARRPRPLASILARSGGGGPKGALPPEARAARARRWRARARGAAFPAPGAVILALSVLVLLSSSAHLAKLIAPDRPPAASRDVDRGGAAGLAGGSPGPDAPHPIKNVVSWSVYGTHERYWGGAIPNARLAATIYPGWEARFYHDEDLPESVREELAAMPNVELRDMTNSSIPNPMSWRFLVALDESITGAYIVRDADSRLSLRERSAVDEWLASNATFHIMHDHPGHCMAPVQGGMWGGKASIPDIRCAIERCQMEGKPLQRGDDLKRLRESVWPVVKKDMMHHDMFCCRLWAGDSHSIAFPTRREGAEHVGSVHMPDLNGTLRWRDTKNLMTAVVNGTRNHCVGRKERNGAVHKG
ncbi:hypothetical protein ACHAWF_003863 [Thalassiosira exigua]